jgi:hypothetical protein
MFKSDRAVRRGFRILGYGVSNRDHKVPSKTVHRFQLNYNKCADRFGHWGKLNVTGKLSKETLNALEHAIRWSKKLENTQGVPSARSWQSLCGNQWNVYPSNGSAKTRAYAQAEGDAPEARGTNFVEVMSDGVGKLRNIHTDHALRCNIIAFERYGDTAFAVVEIPPQADLPGGRPDQITCPCIFAR